MVDPIERIVLLFSDQGERLYDGARRESVTALAHALQCAQLAEWAGAPAQLVVAALLHDIGHFLPNAAGTEDIDEVDDAHELRALSLLRESFDDAIVQPVRLHVQAKRYLVRMDTTYLSTLSPASIHSLGLQGGAMREDEAAAFERLPHAMDAVALRRWDDCAKDPGRATPSLGYYFALVEDVRIDA